MLQYLSAGLLGIAALVLFLSVTVTLRNRKRAASINLRVTQPKWDILDKQAAPKKEISGTNKMYKTQRTPNGLCTAYPKNNQEYGPISNTMTLLKPINKTSLLLPFEQLYIQTHHQHKQLISEQYIGEHNPLHQSIRTIFHTSLPTRPTDQ